MKIAIIALNSKYIHSSLSPWCLRAGIKTFCKNNHDVHVIEATINSDLDKLYYELIESSFDVVAFSCYIWSIEKILSLCSKIKDKTRCITVLGGPEAEFNHKELLKKYRFIDYISSGEGEWSFSSLINYLDGTEKLENCEGINYLDNDKIFSIPHKKHNDTPPSPYCDEYFERINGRITYIEASRGCPYRCAYCLSGGNNGFRYFNNTLIFNEIEKLSASGTKTIKFIDRTFNADYQKANEILSFIKADLANTLKNNVCFHFEISADIIDESTMEILSSFPAGMIQLEIGIQSFNSDSLSAINRRSDLSKLITSVKSLISLRNIHIHTDLIAGLPFEDINSFKNSFNSAFSLQPDMLQLGFLKFLHGTEMRENSQKFSCKFKTSPPYEIISNKWISQADIETLKNCEEALERLYNSRRFLFTLNYLFRDLKFDPFETFSEFGGAYNFERMSLTDFTDKIWQFFKDKCDNDKLREMILCDINSIPVNIHIPDSLVIYDPLYKRLKKKYTELYNKNIKVVILNSEKRVFIAHPDIIDKISGRYYYEFFELDLL